MQPSVPQPVSAGLARHTCRADRHHKKQTHSHPHHAFSHTNPYNINSSTCPHPIKGSRHLWRYQQAPTEGPVIHDGQLRPQAPAEAYSTGSSRGSPNCLATLLLCFCICCIRFQPRFVAFGGAEPHLLRHGADQAYCQAHVVSTTDTTYPEFVARKHVDASSSKSEWHRGWQRASLRNAFAAYSFCPQLAGLPARVTSHTCVVDLHQVTPNTPMPDLH